MAEFGARRATLGIQYAIEREFLGTGGGARLALDQTRGDSVLVLNGDTYFPVDLDALSRFHAETGADMTLALKPMAQSERYGTLTIDSGGRIKTFVEKGAVKNGLISGGIYALKRSLLMRYQLGQAFSLEKDILETLAPVSDFRGMVFDRYFVDIGIPEDYRRAQTELPDLA
jgi:D-glycero-alpha-D-manno-heptose 1-phosphate guanylyltransferase